jgi:hypothetical protein
MRISMTASKKELSIKAVELRQKLRELIKEKETLYKAHLDKELFGNVNKRHMRPSRVNLKQVTPMGKKSMPLRKRKLDQISGNLNDLDSSSQAMRKKNVQSQRVQTTAVKGNTRKYQKGKVDTESSDDEGEEDDYSSDESESDNE